MFFRNLSLLLFLALFAHLAFAQRFTQTVRGTVIDQSLQTPIPGASVVVLNSSPLQGTVTDADGSFRIPGVQVGRQTLKITYLGYQDRLVQNIVVDAGKELVLHVALEEAIRQIDEVTVRPTLEKDKPLNEMATVSARTFSVEETQKFAAAVNDPARMATAYAGVVGADDGGNFIIIRGNSPNGLLWRMEGVEIPNPNHFANLGTAGGGISILSAQLLANSDFMTGAFPAEYGNALAGVFDLRLRRGNNAKREHTIQAGVLGIDVSSEGPFSKKYKGSYLFNYRYSTLGLLSKMGVSIGGGVTTFQDFSFNVYLPTNRIGTFTVFGFGGLSTQTIDAKKDSTQWENRSDRFSDIFKANTGAAGVTHSLNLNRRALLKTVVLASGFGNTYHNERLNDAYQPEERSRASYTVQKHILSSTLTYKFNARHTLRAGVIGARLNYDLLNRDWNDSLRRLQTEIQAQDHTYTLQTFAQWNARLSERLTLNAGLHTLHLFLNHTSAVEPRGSIRWAVTPRQSLSLGYGLHSQLQAPGTYFVTDPTSDVRRQPNRNLGFTRSHHLVLAYDYSLNDHLRLKAETYYQSLFDVPISAERQNAFAVINSFDGFTLQRLTNRGRGRNYGLELTLEQFLHRNLYFLFSQSLYNSEYRASDGIWRDARFNGRYASNLLIGKEYTLGSSGRSVLGLNVKLTYYGGFRSTPIDVAESRRQEKTVYVERLTYSEKLPDYFRTDIRVSWKRNRLRSTRTLSLDIQNVTNRQNVFGQYFDPQSGALKTSYMTPLIPILSYKVVF